jgi:group I intron endonuclease
MIGIYKIENKVNGKVYVGQSVNIESRWKAHKSELRRDTHYNTHLQKSWNKYGEDNFEFSVIEECLEQELDDKEIYWIDYYHCCEAEYGYNSQIGGTGDILYRPVLQFDLSGNFIKEWKNSREAFLSTGTPQQGIYGCCMKKFKHSRYFIWVYKDDYIDKSSLDWYLQNQKSKNVNQYDLYGRFIKTWKNHKEIKNTLGYNVSQCTSHTLLSSHGYIWLYTDDDTKLTEEYCYNVRHSLNFICNKPFYQVNSECEIIKEYNCLRESIEDGYNERMVNECLRGLRDKAKGYIWIYKNEYENLTVEKCHEIFNKPIEIKYYEILQYDLYGNFVHKYDFLNDVPKEFLKSNIADCCRGRKKQYKGYIWEFGKETINPQSHQVEMYDKNTGELLNTFVSLNDAAKITKINETSIGGVCNHKHKTAGGYIWKYSEDDSFVVDKDYIEKLNIHGGCKSLLVFDTENNFIKKYNSIKSAVEDGYTASSIRKCCRNEIDTYRGYIWKYGEVS